MYLGLNTAEQARILAQINSEIRSQPELGKFVNVLNPLIEHQFRNDTSTSTTPSNEIIVPTIVAQKISELWGYDIVTTSVPPPSDTSGLTTTWVRVDSISWANQAIGETRTEILQADIINAEVVANTLKTVFTFPVKAGKGYYFKCFIPYTAALTTTGSRWTVNGPVGTKTYKSTYPLTATTQTINFASVYNIPALCNATSLLIGNATLEGSISPTVDGDVLIRFASEVTLSAITAKAGAILEYKRTQ